MTLRDRQDRLLRATEHGRVALLAAIGERMFPIYEKHWVGDHAVEVSRTIEQGWRRATGLDVPAADLVASRTQLQALVEFYNEESIGILAQCTTLALRLVQCLEASTEEEAVLAAARGTGNHLSAATLADRAIHDAKAPGFPAEAEEQAWQARALERLETWRAPIERHMFSDLGPLPPAWWPAYEAARHPI